MGLEVLCQMASVVEALLENGAGVSSCCLVLLVAMFSGVMLLEVISSIKALVAQSTSKADRLEMSLQRFLPEKRFAAHVAHRPLSRFLGWWQRRWQRWRRLKVSR